MEDVYNFAFANNLWLQYIARTNFPCSLTRLDKTPISIHCVTSDTNLKASCIGQYVVVLLKKGELKKEYSFLSFDCDQNFDITFNQKVKLRAFLITQVYVWYGIILI